MVERKGFLLPYRRELLLKPGVRLGVFLGALSLVCKEGPQLQDVGVDLLTLVASQRDREVGYADLRCAALRPRVRTIHLRSLP